MSEPIKWTRVSAGLYQAGWLVIERSPERDWLVTDDAPGVRDEFGMARLVASCRTLTEARARAQAYADEMVGEAYEL